MTASAEPGLRYTELPPPPALRPWIASLWQIRGTLPPGTVFLHRVLPDGCADLILERGRPSAAQLVGPMSTAAVIPSAGEPDMVGLRLRPGAHVLLAALDARELVDEALVPAATGPALRRLSERLTDALDSEAGLPARAARVWAAFLPVASAGPRRDPLVVHALTRWSAAGGPAGTVGDLVRSSGLSERAVERRFSRATGFRPAELRRLARFRALLRLRAAGAQGWGALAAACGYADQAHLVRDFRSFAGVAPTAWAAEQARAGFVQDGAIAAL
jgi:AraC-like DNA-binding protein